nr:MAG TPA: hypothetical protein [Bacteriophage sp.]
MKSVLSFLRLCVPISISFRQLKDFKDTIKTIETFSYLR